MLLFFHKVLGNILWESKTGIKYNFIVNKPQTNAFVAFVFLWGEMSRQQVAFREECRKIKGSGSLEGDFYTRFMTGN